MPIGTSGMTTARAQRVCGIGYSRSPRSEKQGAQPHGPALAQPIHDGAEQQAPHHQREDPDVREDRPIVFSVRPNSACR